MRFHSFLIKYGEIGIKGKNRYLFEDALVRQIRFALKDVDGEFNVHKAQGRVYVDCEGEYDYEETVESLKRVFGIVGICPVVRLQDNGFEQLKKDLYLDWGISCGEMEEKGMLTFLDSGMKVTVSLGLDGNRNVCLTAVVLGEEGQQLEAELELERVLESCRKQKEVG